MADENTRFIRKIGAYLQLLLGKKLREKLHDDTAEVNPDFMGDLRKIINRITGGDAVSDSGKRETWRQKALKGKIRELPMTKSDSQMKNWLRKRLAQLAKEHKGKNGG
jgi:hypothetical protein